MTKNNKILIFANISEKNFKKLNKKNKELINYKGKNKLNLIQINKKEILLNKINDRNKDIYIFINSNIILEKDIIKKIDKYYFFMDFNYKKIIKNIKIKNKLKKIYKNKLIIKKNKYSILNMEKNIIKRFL